MRFVTEERLRGIYRDGDDPWCFRTSRYEQDKFRATDAALTRHRYVAGLEIGCGNGELAALLSLRCDSYVGVDAVEAALGAAKRRVPSAQFRQLYLPAELPGAPFDLIVLSEILYFLDEAGIDALAGQLDRRWPDAEIVCVTYLGDTGNPLQGEAALGIFAAAIRGPLDPVCEAPGYRIDLRAGETGS